MYLSELFLDCIGTDYTQKSIHEAMNICEEEYQKRREVGITKEELLDFYDVVKEFRKELRVSDYQVLQILIFRQKRVA